MSKDSFDSEFFRKANVIPFPQMSDEDKQFLSIERQAELIKKQQEKIAELLATNGEGTK
jgi:hypothetical protein